MSCDHKYVQSLRKFYEVCIHCGTGHSLAADDPYFIYRDDYYSAKHNRSTIEEQVFNVETHTERGRTKNDFVMERLKPPTFNGCLEIGCAPGSLLKRLRSFGFKKVVGIEVDEQYEPNIRAIAGEKPELLFGFFPAVTEKKFPKNSFSVIVALDVLEHCFFPDKFLAECRRLLVREGQLFLMLTLVGKDKYLDEKFFFPSQHVFIHSEDHITALLKGAGFKDVHLDEWTNGHDTVTATKA